MSKSETVTLSRAKYDAMIERVEDAEDLATVAAAEAVEKALGKGAARRDALPLALAEELVGGKHPARVWRKHRGLTLDALSSKTGIGQSYLTEIETRKKPGSLDAIRKIAAALDVSLDDLAAWV